MAKSAHYVTATGRVIHGLTKLADGRFGIIGNSYIKFGRNESKAIARYIAWLWENDSEKAKALFPDETTASNAAEVANSGINVCNCRNYYRQLILNNPELAAKILDIDWLATVKHQVIQLEPSLTLSDIGEWYISKNHSAEWKRKISKHWKQFIAITDCKTVRDITDAAMSKYNAAILGQDNSPTYARHRFGNIKSVLANALKRGKQLDDINRALLLCKMLDTPSKQATDPKPISREHFKTLLDAANPKLKVALLLSLNACMYPSEVGNVMIAEIDMQKQCLVTARNKTGIVRIATLWPRTIQAIQEYRKTVKAESLSLLVNKDGNKYSANSLGQHFRSLRFKARVPAAIEFAHIRDGAYTAAIEAGIALETTQLLAGHATGIADAYVRRNPRMVAEACEAIERHYFG